MKSETIKEHAERLLEIGKRKLEECKTFEGRRRIKKTNKYLREVIRIKC